jgi:hypothetical protein
VTKAGTESPPNAERLRTERFDSVGSVSQYRRGQRWPTRKREKIMNAVNESLYHLAGRDKLDTWVPACGGQEVPFTFEGTRWLYVWNPGRAEHGYLNLDNDRVYPDYRSES